MAVKIRLSRGGAKKRPHYRIVAADIRAPRDGRFIEKLGSWDPLLPKDHAGRVTLNSERIRHWLANGATPTDRVARFLDEAGLWKRSPRNNPQKAQPGKKAQERVEAEKARKEAAAAPPPAPEPAPEAAPESEPAPDAAEETAEAAVKDDAGDAAKDDAKDDASEEGNAEGDDESESNAGGDAKDESGKEDNAEGDDNEAESDKT